MTEPLNKEHAFGSHITIGNRVTRIIRYIALYQIKKINWFNFSLDY